MSSLTRLTPFFFCFFFFNAPATTEIYTLSLHDALPISPVRSCRVPFWSRIACTSASVRSEEHTSELQSRRDLVCRLLLEKKKVKRDALDVIHPTECMSDARDRISD